MKYFAAFALVLIFVYLIIPLLRKYALKIGFVDKPTERKKHKEPTPLSGGVAIYIGFLLGCLMFIKPFDKELIYILFSSLLILAIGLIDDWFKTKGKEFSAAPRLLVQLIAAVIIFKAGIVFTGFTNPFTHRYIILPLWLQFCLTITWIIGVTVVFGWSDGMDGLTGTITAVSGTTLFIVALAKGQSYTAILSIILVASVLGFLRYNKPPAMIFMGDSGATFLGFILGIIALEGAFKQATVISVLIPILALGLPIFDNLFVVVNRIIEKRPIYKADASQMHHRLQSAGLNPKQTLSFITLLCLCFSFLSIILLLVSVLLSG